MDGRESYEWGWAAMERALLDRIAGGGLPDDEDQDPMVPIVQALPVGVVSERAVNGAQDRRDAILAEYRAIAAPLIHQARVDAAARLLATHRPQKPTTRKGVGDAA